MNPTMLIIFGVLIIGLIAMSFFQNKQRKKQAVQEQEKKSRICAGTKIITIGGIMGVVVSVDLVLFFINRKNEKKILEKGGIQ